MPLYLPDVDEYLDRCMIPGQFPIENLFELLSGYPAIIVFSSNCTEMQGSKLVSHINWDKTFKPLEENRTELLWARNIMLLKLNGIDVTIDMSEAERLAGTSLDARQVSWNLATNTELQLILNFF